MTATFLALVLILLTANVGEGIRLRKRVRVTAKKSAMIEVELTQIKPPKSPVAVESKSITAVISVFVSFLQVIRKMDSLWEK